MELEAQSEVVRKSHEPPRINGLATLEGSCDLVSFGEAWFYLGFSIGTLSYDFIMSHVIVTVTGLVSVTPNRR